MLRKIKCAIYAAPEVLNFKFPYEGQLLKAALQVQPNNGQPDIDFLSFACLGARILHTSCKVILIYWQ